MPRAWRKRQEEFALQGQRSRFIALASTERAATKALTRCQGAIAFLIGDFCNKICQQRKCQPHSITSSARASTVGGISRPSAFAVLRLMISSNLVGCSIGRSAGLAPFKIL